MQKHPPPKSTTYLPFPLLLPFHQPHLIYTHTHTTSCFSLKPFHTFIHTTPHMHTSLLEQLLSLTPHNHTSPTPCSSPSHTSPFPSPFLHKHKHIPHRTHPYTQPPLRFPSIHQYHTPLPPPDTHIPASPFFNFSTKKQTRAQHTYYTHNTTLMHTFLLHTHTHNTHTRVRAQPHVLFSP